MIKRILFTFVFIFLSLSFYNNTVFAKIATKEQNGFELELYSITGETISPTEEKEAVAVLKQTFGYEGTEYKKGEDTIRCRTKIEIIEVKDKKYIIQIGESSQADGDEEYKPITMPPKSVIGIKTDWGFKQYYSFEELSSMYGYEGDEKSLKVGTKWDVLLICSGIEEKWESGSGNSVAGQRLTIKATKLYSGNDYNTGEQKQLNEGTQFVHVETIQEAVKNSFGKILSKIFMMFLELFRSVNGDGFQIILNTIETSNYAKGLGKIKPWTIDYEPEDILKDENKNAYINFSEDGTNNGVKGQAKKVVKAKDYGFKDKTPVPIIPVDLYTIATGEIKEFDVNFFENNSSEQDSKWIKIRNSFTTTVLHTVIYIGSAFLLSVLIWHGIYTVKGSILPKKSLTPQEKLIHKKRLHDIVISIIMLAGTIVVMNLCIHLTYWISGTIKVSETNEAPIRVILKDDEPIYSFSTNITGYFRYMSGISKVGKIGDKFMYTILYIVFVWMNILAVLCMFVRTIALMILSIKGPITAVLHSIDKEKFNHMSFQNWVVQYFEWSGIQIIFAIAYKIVLQVCF